MTPAARRIGALRRFAVALTVFNLLGHTVLGFEQSTAQPLVALAVAYAMELGLELADSRLNRRRTAFLGGGVGRFVDFLLPGHITALAVSMLLYANDELWPVMFATAAAVGSKHVLRVRIGEGTRHFFNPSNFGISLTLIAFSRVGIAPPYQFSENLTGWLSWLLPVLITFSGTFINWRFTGRIPVLAAWVVGFAAQALLRAAILGANPLATLAPMTGLVFVLYTFYMVTDPATTPAGWRAQLVFGAGVAAAYALLVIAHVVFGFFFGLTIVCGLRGALVYGSRILRERRRAAAPAPGALLGEAGGGG
jgi:Na+-translocating ferredoxin:NAD+ oxidoreductase RnfD subunit